MIVKEIDCKTALVRTGLPGGKYALNPYRGCEHACLYCYAPSVLRETRQWGSFVDVKKNIADVLEREISRQEKGNVLIGTVTDAYQPIEKRYKITRRCLEVLAFGNWPVSIQTKSALVVRDADLLLQVSKKDVGFTITTLDEKVQKKFEPLGSSPSSRLSALKELSDAGIQTWIFIGPLLPGITESELERIITEAANAGAKSVLWDKLRLKPGVKERMGIEVVSNSDDISAKIDEACKVHGLICNPAFPTDNLNKPSKD